jgi:hypothetical protein
VKKNVTSKIISSFKITKAVLPILLLTLALVFTVSIDDVSAASGDTIYVNDTSGNDDNDGSDWTTAKKTIKNATGSVNVNGIVNIANGQYNGTSNTRITIDKNMTINGESQTGTIINGTGTNWIFYVNPGINLTLNNLTITNATRESGGAIYNYGNVSVTNSILTSNTATNYGGAIYNYGNVSVTDTSFTGNTASLGGAINNRFGSVSVSGSAISGNTAYYMGGGIYNYANTVTVSDSTISDNTALFGGGIFNTGNVTVSGSTISGNTANYIAGGIYNEGTLMVSGSTISGNNAPEAGGIFNTGNVTVSGSTISGNTANYGGGIYIHNGNVTVSGSTISGNIAQEYGGGIYNSHTLEVSGSTISGNTATQGGGIYNYSDNLTVSDSTISRNTADYGGGIFNWGTLMVSGSTISGNTADYGGGIYNWGTLTLNFNRIVVNSPTAIHNDYGSVDAEYNWWGSNNPNFTTLIIGNVDYNPWLYMTLQTNPTNIEQGETSTLTASFNNAFDGTTVTPLNPDNGHIPDKTPVTFNTDLGSVGSKTINKETTDGTATATLTADETAGIAHVNAVTDSQTVNNDVTINPKSSLYLTIKPSKTNPMVGETVIYTLKVGNKGPDTAENVVMTYTIPEGLEFAGAQVDVGTYTYDPTTRTITWKIGDVPVGDPYMWLSLKVTSAGRYLINPLLSTITYDPTLNSNTQSLTFNAAATPNNNNNTNNTVNAATNTVTMQKTGIPLIVLIMALFMVIGGLVSSKK